MSLQRVVTVCSSSNWGGTEKWSLRASEELAGRGVSVEFVCRDPEIFHPHLRGNNKIRFVQLPFRNEADFGTMFRLSSLFRGADAVVLTRVRDYWLGGLAARISGVPALLRLGIVRHLRRGYLMDRLRYSTLPSALLVNADAIRETLLETPWMRGVPIHRIYNGVESPGRPDDDMVRAARERFDVPQGAIWLVGSGRLAVEKRWHLLVEATAKLALAGIEVRATLFGEGSERSRLGSLVHEHSLEGIVQLQGYTPQAAELVGCADLMLLPSDNEGLSNTMLEAMGQGVPVVASASGGVREVFSSGEELLLVDADDKEKLCESVLRLARDKALRSKIGDAGFAAVRNRFSWQRMGYELEALLDDLAKGGES